MWNGHNLSDEIRSALFFAAQDMFKAQKDFKLLKSELCEGEITTEWKTARMGGVFGYIFSAVVAWENKDTQITYIVRQAEINPEDAVWTRPLPEPSAN